MVKKEFVEQMESRKVYRNLWHTDLTNTIRADFPFCCLAVWCAPCVSYHLRKRALYNDMSRYVCCAGYLPCSGHCGEQQCPEFCLGTEVFCCFGNSVQSTRFLLQDEFNIQTTKCDNCIIGFMFVLQQVACIFSIVAAIIGNEEIEAASNILTLAADAVYCSVCACMQTQHKVEMDKRDGVFGDNPMRPPQQVMMSRFDQPVPPAIGYPPVYAPPAPYPPSYGPPQAYPPQQGYQGPPQQVYGGSPQQGYGGPAQQGYGGGYPPQQPPQVQYPPSHGYYDK